MSKLMEVNIADTRVSDLTPLSDKPSLYQLKAENTAVTDWSPVSEIPSVIGRPESE